MARLVMVGGGKMGEALVAGLLDGGWAAEDLAVVEVDAGRREALAARFAGVEVSGELVKADGAVLAVKPGDIPAACRQLSEFGVSRLLSIAAGVTLATMEANVPAGTSVIRAMPNTPALVGAGMAAITGGTSATEDDLVWAESVLGAVGRVVRTSEVQLDAVTGLSGSGPAYIFLVAEALIEAGVLSGLPRDVSTELAIGTLLGSARMLAESGQGPEALRAAVTSPGGTTAAGLRALEKAGVRSAFLDAVTAAMERAQEMGRS